MRIAAMAAGAVGGYFGARLAKAGHDVFFIARGEHLKAMRKDGLKVASVHGDIHLSKPNVTDNPAEVGPVDIVLFAVKLWDTEKAAEATKPLLGVDTRVITLQNGVDSYERIAPIIGAKHAVPGATYVVTVIDRPGVISQTSQAQLMVFGAVDGKVDPQLQAFADALKAAGVSATLSDNIERERWQKFVLLTGTSGVTALTRFSMGPILADPDTRALFRKTMLEVVEVGRAKGVAIDESFVDDRIAFADKSFPPTMKASMANDLDRGNRLELDWLAGMVSKLGRDLGVPTPANDTIYAALKLHRNGR
ncbi:MAG: 2-dehydropantoate 2-reductase [Pseudolabrys sp.]